MIKLVKLLCIFVMLLGFTNSAIAKNNSIEKSMISWILNESKHNVNETMARTIVRNIMIQSKRTKLDPFLLLSLIKNESGFRKNVRSSQGALGLMQVIPKWHKDKISGRSITAIDVNIEVGSTILRDCIDSRKNIDLALRCYSGGARNYTRKLNKTYNEIRTHAILFKFKNELPIVVTGNFNKPNLPDTFKVAQLK